MAGNVLAEAFIQVAVDASQMTSGLNAAKSQFTAAVSKMDDDFLKSVKLKEDASQRLGEKLSNLKMKPMPVDTMAKQRLSIILGEADAFDDMVARKVAATNRSKAAAKGLNPVLRAGVGGYSRLGMAAMQASFGFQDFITVATMPGMGVAGGLRGAANNIAQVASIALPPAIGAAVGLAVTLGASLIPMLFNSGDAAEDTKSRIDALTDSFRQMGKVLDAKHEMRLAGAAGRTIKTAEAASSAIEDTTFDNMLLDKKMEDRQQEIERLNVAKGGLVKASIPITAAEQAALGEMSATERLGAFLGPALGMFIPGISKEAGAAMASEFGGTFAPDVKTKIRDALEAAGPGARVQFSGGKALVVGLKEADEVKALQEEINKLEREMRDLGSERAVNEVKIRSFKQKQAELQAKEREEVRAALAVRDELSKKELEINKRRKQELESTHGDKKLQAEVNKKFDEEIATARAAVEEKSRQKLAQKDEKRRKTAEKVAKLQEGMAEDLEPAKQPVQKILNELAERNREIDALDRPDGVKKRLKMDAVAAARAQLEELAKRDKRKGAFGSFTGISELGKSIQQSLMADKTEKAIQDTATHAKRAATFLQTISQNLVTGIGP